MPFPKQRDLEIPLLRAIQQAGGAVQPRDLCPKLAAQFSLSVEEQEERLPSSPTTRKWTRTAPSFHSPRCGPFRL